MQINTVHDFRRAIRNGAYAWPGGYPLYFVTSDGSALSFDAARAGRRQIIRAIGRNENFSGWKIVGVDVNWENPVLYCEETGDRIPSAYGED